LMPYISSVKETFFKFESLLSEHFLLLNFY
jgi:hypothetical protein